MPSDVSTPGAQDRGHSVEELKRELAEAHRRETATAEILRVISRSPSDVQPVFDTIVRSAVRVCDGLFGAVVRFDGELMHLAAYHNYTPEVLQALQQMLPMRPDSRLVAGRAILTREMVHVEDALADPEFAQRVARTGGFRSMLAVPMLREGNPIGAIVVNREQPGPFSAARIELLKTFADQAVIAIENTRMFEAEQASKRELTEALEQQTATADVLKVISRSALDLQRVLDALVESAARLCNAYDAVIFQVFGDGMRLVAHHGQIPLAGPVGQHTVPLVPGLIAARAIIERRTIHVADVLAEADGYPESRSHALQFGYRTALGVPLVHAGEAIGVILIRRTEVRPFTERQLELVNTFADQAVIAIENTRLFDEVQARNRELRTALEQQTATSELLKVIGRSTLDVHPVFETLAENAVKLCEAQHAFIFRFDGQLLRCVATYNIPPALREFVEANPVRPARGSGAGRAALERRTIQIEDIRTDPDFTYGVVQVGPMRTLLAVPMLRADELLGVIVITRPEVRLFTNNQIALMETFADQAVIAIENTRLFEEVQARTRELTENLEYQTATSEVLNVISRSPSQVQPVLDAIAGTAARLCSAEYAFIGKAVDGKIHLAAASSMDSEHARWLQQHPVSIDRSSATGLTALERRAIHIPDILADPEFAHQDWQNVGRQRTILGMPLLHEGNLVGVIMLVRNMVRPFTQRQIELVTTFADQAVIAINNVRLFEEVQLARVN